MNLFRFPLKTVKVMHTVALRTESSLPKGTAPPNPTAAFKVLHVFIPRMEGSLSF